MRIGVRGHDMERVPFEQLVANIKKKGFHCTQLALSKAIYEFNVSEEAMTPGMALYLKQVFAENKVDVAVLGCYLNLANPNKEQLRKTIDTYKAHIRFASLLGCGVVGTETGAVNEEYRFEEANHSEEALQIFINNFREVVEYAEKMGVIIAIEPVWKHIVCDIKRARKVLDAINSPNLQIIFDPVNTIDMHNYEKQDELLTEAFTLLRDEIAVIHAKDFIVEDGAVKSVVSGKGMLNYDLLMGLIKKHKPFVHVLLEDTNPDNVIETREFVERKYREA
ncbi:MAG: sugar phosphate isomerase/epimerase [Lachnospiraceae bacterium]|nr:sugar phosphate isomerase/epimerase [Lachnospiraceae bacterium]